MRKLGILFVTLALALLACGDDGETASTTTATEEPATTVGSSETTVSLSDATATSPGACDVAESLDLETLVGFALAGAQDASGSYNGVDFESCSFLEEDAGPDDDGTVRPRSVAIQFAMGATVAAAAATVAEDSPQNIEVDLSDLPPGSFVTAQSGSDVVWVPTDEHLFGVSVVKSLGDFEFESDDDAAVAVAVAVLDALG